MQSEAYGLVKAGVRYLLVGDGRPVLTPSGRLLASQHRDLAEYLLDDARIHGVLPGFALSTVSLQSAYLDYGYEGAIEWLLEGIESQLELDIWFNQPPEPELAQLHLGTFGSGSCSCSEISKRMATMSKRQLTAITVTGINFDSATLGVMFADPSNIEPDPLLGRMFCRLYLSSQIRKPEFLAPGDLWGIESPASNSDFCRKCCRRKKIRPEEFSANCPVYQALRRIRLFSQFPDAEEVP